MGSQCRSGGLQGRHTCAVPRVRSLVSEHGISWVHSVVAAAFKAAKLARRRGCGAWFQNTGFHGFTVPWRQPSRPPHLRGSAGSCLGFITRDFMGSRCRSGCLQGRHTCAMPRVQGHGFRTRNFAAAHPARSSLIQCVLATMPPPRGRIKPMLPLVVSGHGNGFPVLLQPSSLFSAAKAAGFPGGFHRARSAAGWLNREDTGAGNPAAEQRVHICYRIAMTSGFQNTGRTRFFCPYISRQGQSSRPCSFISTRKESHSFE